MIIGMFAQPVRRNAISTPRLWGLTFILFYLAPCHIAGAQPAPKPKGQIAPYPGSKAPTKAALPKKTPSSDNKAKVGGPSQGGSEKPASPGQIVKKPASSNTSSKLAFLLEIRDSSGLMKMVPQVVATSAKGKTVNSDVIDNGKPPDQTKGDNTYTGPIHQVEGKDLASILITAGELEWLIKVDSNNSTNADRIVIQLQKKGKASYLFKSRQGAKRPGTPPSNSKPGATPSNSKPGANPSNSKPGANPSNVTPGDAPKPNKTAKSGKVPWPMIVAAITAVVLICIAFYMRRRNRQLILELEGGVATGIFPPRRLESEQIAALLAGPLAGHRVVTLGALETSSDAVIRCMSKYPLPDSLVRAMERLAVTPGQPLALLVTDPDQLAGSNAMDPLEMLAEEVEGRFPLWVVDGFEDWEALEDAPPPEEEAKDK